MLDPGEVAVVDEVGRGRPRTFTDARHSPILGLDAGARSCRRRLGGHTFRSCRSVGGDQGR